MDVRMPDGTIITNVPEGTTKAQLEAKLFASRAAPQAQAPTQPTDADSPFLGSLKAGTERLKGEAALLAGKVGLMDEAEAVKYREEKEKLAEQTYVPTEKGWSEAPLTKVKELAGSSLPYMVPPVVAAAAAPAVGVGALGATVLGGTASALQFTGTNLARQMDENNQTLGDTSLLKAGSAAVPQAALDIIGFKMLPGIRRIFSQAGMEISEQAALEAAKRGILAKAGQYSLNTGKIMGIEGATEAGQQFLERLQAGLSVTDPAAREEYLQSFIGGAVLGGVFAVPGQAVEKVMDKRAERKREVEDKQKETGKPAKSLFEEQDEEDAAATAEPTAQTAEQPVDTSFDFGANAPQPPAGQPAVQAAEVDDMIDPETGFPYFTGVRSREAAQQEYNEANAQLDAAVKSGSEAEYETALERVKKARADLGVVNRGEIGEQAPLFAGKKPVEEDIYGPTRRFDTIVQGEPWTYFGPGAEVNQDSYPGAPAKVVAVHEPKNGIPTYTLEVDTRNHPEGYDENGNKVDTKLVNIPADRLNRLNPSSLQQEAPLFAQQQGLDLGAPTSERAQPIESSKTTAAQLGLDFTQDPATGEYTAPKFEPRTFGMTTETSAEPLQKFLSQFKPRSTSEVERNKQQAGLFGVRDENNQLKTSGLLDKISELYEDATPEEAGYYKGVIDSFFDQYAGVKRPSTDEALGNINNLSAEDQARTLKDYTYLPDLTTYEGVKKLSDAFDDHVAEAQLAGLGITRSSSAYRQIDPIVRNLRAKPKASYDAAEQAAFDYFDMYNLDNALRAAAFDIATNTPRNQLFRGQGREAAENFNEWLLFNAPKKVQYLFDQYVKGYRKQNEGYQSFQALQDTAEAEAEYVESYAGPKKSGENRVGMGALHPAIVAHVRNNNLQGALALLARTGRTPYERTLARQLASLELNTTIGLDGVEVAANDYLKAASDSVGRFAQGAALYFPEFSNVEQSILDAWNNAPSNFARFNRLEEVLNRFDEAVKERNLDIGAFKDVTKDLKDKLSAITTSFTADGVYFPLSNSISLNGTKAGALSPYTLLHEAMHAATSRIVANPMIYSPKQQEAVKELNKLYEFAKKNAKGFDYYGLTNVDEFIAEAFTSKSFQKFLQGINYKYANTSLYDKFVEFCLKIFGYNNVLSSTIANVNVLFDAPNENTFKNAPPLFAKRNEGMFESNSAERSKPFAIMRDLVKNVKSWNDVKANLAEGINTMNTEQRKNWLKLLTVRQMEEMIGTEFGLNPETGKMEYISKLPQISQYLRLTEKMSGERDKVIHSHTVIARKLMKLQSNNLPTVEKLNNLVQYATVNEVDPGKIDASGNMVPFQPKDPTKLTDREKEQAKAYVVAKRLWDELGKSPEGKQAQSLYREMRDFFSDRLAEFKAIAYEREENRMLAEAAAAERKSGEAVDEDVVKQKAREKIDKTFSDKIDPYFPLKRFGEYWVRVGKGKDRKYMQFEDAKAKQTYLKKELDAYERQLRKEGRDDAYIKAELAGNSYINDGNSLPELAKDVFSSKEVFDEVLSIVNTGGKDITDVEELRALMEDQLGELYITTLPLQSIKRMFLHRQNVQGASADLIRSFQHAAMHMAYQHARFKYSPQLDDQLAAAKSRIDLLKRTNRDEANVLTDYLNAIKDKYDDNVRTPVVSSPWVNKLSSINFLWFLTAPASAVVNTFAIPNIALPVMGGKFGMADSGKALIKYMRKLPSAGWKDPETGKFDTPSMRRAEGLSEIEKKALDAAPEGMFEQSLAHDAATLGESPSYDFTGTWGKIMEIATFPFHKAERFNREVTYMAAFELAYKKNGGNFNAAVKEASDITYKTMFDYATQNKPKIMQGDVAKVVLAFKQYPQHFTYLLFRTGYEATQNVSEAEYNEVLNTYGKEAADKYQTDTNQLRAEARKSFMLMMGMSFLFAGAAGLPFWWLYEGMAKAFNAMFGDDEVPYDVNNEFKNKMTQVFGGFVGDSISRGVIPQITGLSLSDRMSTNLPDLWFRDVKQNQDEVQYAQNMMINLLGPTAGILLNGAEAVKRFNDGNVERAAEALAPAVFKNVLAGSRLAKEGALTMKGDTLIEDISGPEAFKQMLGFTPERLAQRQAANIEAKSYEQKVLARKQDLLNFLAMAIDNEDEDAEAKVLAKIDEFNEANDWAAISGKTIRTSLKKRAQNRAKADESGGMNFNKNFADIAKEKTEYADDEDD
jgi:hypothetical protein